MIAQCCETGRERAVLTQLATLLPPAVLPYIGKTLCISRNLPCVAAWPRSRDMRGFAKVSID